MVSFKKKTLSHLSPLPSRFRKAREANRVTLREVEDVTHVRPRYLSALESGRYDTLPPDVFATGFVRRYAKFLGLPEDEAVIQFRKERGIFRSMAQNASPLSLKSVPGKLGFSLSAKSLVLLTSVILVLGLVGYVWWQVRAFTSPPYLSLTAPQSNATVDGASVTVEGETSANSTVLINDAPVPISENLHFSEDLKLSPGVNTIEVKAISRLKKETVKTINIFSTR
jgi:cytoskeletal protein RodZ